MDNQVLVNRIIQDDEGKKFRVIGIDKIEDQVILFDLNKGSLNLVRRDIMELDKAILSKEVRFVEEIYKLNINGRILSDNDREKRDKGWEIIKGIYEITGENGIFDRQIRGVAIKTMSEKHDLTDKTIREYVRRYFERGMLKDSLIPDNKNSGRKTATSVANETSANKKVNTDAKGIYIDEKIQKIFKKAIDRFYNNSKKISLRTAYELMIGEYFSSTVTREDGKEILKVMDSSSIPTFSQFRYWHYKNRDIRKELIGRGGSKNYNLKNRAVLFSSTDEAIGGPAHIYQIDATLADFYLVSSYDNQEIAGRPVFYLVLDVFSRMIVGVSVSLRPPSFIGAAEALLNTAIDKKKFCEEYGIEITHQEWPCNNLPTTLLADRGELEGGDIETLVENLGLKISNTSSFRGDNKPIIERYIGLLQDTIKPYLTGVIREDFQKRGAPDYRLTATLNLYQFTQVVIKTILYFNNNYLPAYERDESMIRDGVAPIPVKLWEWGIENRSGKLKYLDEEILKYYLLPRDKARVTKNGIVYKRIRYACEKALKEGWFEKAREKGSWSIKIMFDPRVVEYIYILDETAKEFQKCTILNNSSRYMKKSFDDIDYLMEKERKEKTILEHDKLQSKVNLIKDIENIVSDSRKEVENRDIGVKSKKTRLKDIKNNKTAEKLLEDKKKGIRLKDQTERKEMNIIDTSENVEKGSDVINDLFKAQEEMFDD